MAAGDFVWADLSAYRLGAAEGFYGALFGWRYASLEPPEGPPYRIASTPEGTAAGLFDMPADYRRLGLPSFWMPYFSVGSVEAACAEALRSGGKVELGPLAWSDTDAIALIRDPLGAGFTVHAGPSFSRPQSTWGASGGAASGFPIWAALYVSDVSAVRDFYAKLFGWRIAQHLSASGAHRVRTSAARDVADMYALDEALRGKSQFWGVHFGCNDLERAERIIADAGGAILHRDDSAGEMVLLAQDPDGAAFFLRSGAPHAA